MWAHSSASCLCLRVHSPPTPTLQPPSTSTGITASAWTDLGAPGSQLCSQMRPMARWPSQSFESCLLPTVPSPVRSPGTGPPRFLVSPLDESPLAFLRLRVGSSGPVSRMGTQGESSGRGAPASRELPSPAPVSTQGAPRSLPPAAPLSLQNFHLAPQLHEPVLTLELASCPPATTSHSHPSGPPNTRLAQI